MKLSGAPAACPHGCFYCFDGNEREGMGDPISDKTSCAYASGKSHEGWASPATNCTCTFCDAAPSSQALMTGSSCNYCRVAINLNVNDNESPHMCVPVGAACVDGSAKKCWLRSPAALASKNYIEGSSPSHRKLSTDGWFCSATPFDSPDNNPGGSTAAGTCPVVTSPSSVQLKTYNNFLTIQSCEDAKTKGNNNLRSAQRAYDGALAFTVGDGQRTSCAWWMGPGGGDGCMQCNNEDDACIKCNDDTMCLDGVGCREADGLEPCIKTGGYCSQKTNQCEQCPSFLSGDGGNCQICQGVQSVVNNKVLPGDCSPSGNFETCICVSCSCTADGACEQCLVPTTDSGNHKICIGKDKSCSTACTKFESGNQCCDEKGGQGTCTLTNPNNSPLEISQNCPGKNGPIWRNIEEPTGCLECEVRRTVL